MENYSTAAKSKVNFVNIVKYAGAIIALLIGSGFATGQEVVQYFTSYGWAGVLAVLLMFILMTYVMIEFMNAGSRERFEDGNDIYYYYCGKILGTFYDYFSVFFLFLSFTVMVAGAGATGAEHFGWPTYYAGIGLGVLALISCITGLKKIVDIIGTIGPVIVILAILLGLASIIMNFNGFANVEQNIAATPLLKASPNWLLSSLSYVGFCMLWLAAFVSQMGKQADSTKEANAGAILGSGGFSLAVFVVYLGLLAAIPKIAGSQIPNLVIARSIHPAIATAFTIMIFGGIYTTAVPLLWSVVARFSKEGTPRFKGLTVALGVIGIAVGLLMKFDQLVNIVYVLNGYIGIFLIVLMLVKTFTRGKAKTN